MKFKPKTTLAERVVAVEDLRIERSNAHLLIVILTIAILAIICGADGWVSIEIYGRSKYR